MEGEIQQIGFPCEDAKLRHLHEVLLELSRRLKTFIGGISC